jgi:hypothetical protein
MTLDERIKQDLTQIYDNEIIPLKEVIASIEEKFKLSEAEKLSKIFNDSNSDDAVSTRGLPGYFAGKRDAKTVLLMLNPGQDVAQANNLIKLLETISKKNYKIDSLEEFISSYKEGSLNYGKIDKERADNFDLKQAAFLKAWKGCGVRFPKGFLDDDNKKVDSKSEIALKAKKNVLMQKLSMDLVPYASSEFKGIKSDRIKELFPYLETLFEELFSAKRTYVIFCSAFYKDLFDRYNYDHPDSIVFDKKEKNDKIFNNNAYCQAIRIYRNGNKQGPSIKALIAHTFPSKALPNAYERMEEYGAFCYNVFKNSKI